MALLALLFVLAPLGLSVQAHAKADCGGLNQKSCWSLNPKKWCDGDLKYQGNGKPGDGRCVKRSASSKPKPSCGRLNQKSCWHLDRKKWCQKGLEYVGTGKPGDGRCIKPGADYDKSCGGKGQPSCWNVDTKRWCDKGLEYFGSGKPGEGRCLRLAQTPRHIAVVMGRKAAGMRILSTGVMTVMLIAQVSSRTRVHATASTAKRIIRQQPKKCTTRWSP